MQRYEMTFITRSELTEKEFSDHFDSIIKYLEDVGGKMLDRHDWGPTALAYPIKRHKKGVYTTLLFDGEKETVRKVESKLRLNEAILRFLSIKIPNSQNQIVKSFRNMKEKNNVSS